MRHPLHALCPYFAMFPEDFVSTQLLAYSRPGDTILDPFCGRGTTVLESLLRDRNAIGIDINPVAACVAGAKAVIPTLSEILGRIAGLQADYQLRGFEGQPETEFFRRCFHPETFKQIGYLRANLRWTTDPVDKFIASVTLGALHGESHRSSRYLSNRMPRTISTKPDYSVRWWEKNGYIAPERNAFSILKEVSQVRLAVAPPERKGVIVHTDARKAAKMLKNFAGSVNLVVTSPPYFDMTDYSEDQWLRTWFLGGQPIPVRRLGPDDRHTKKEEYWRFLSEVWRSLEPLFAPKCTFVIRIGGSKLTQDELSVGLRSGMKTAWPQRRIRARQPAVVSDIGRGQAAAFRPGLVGKRVEHDFVFSAYES